MTTDDPRPEPEAAGGASPEPIEAAPADSTEMDASPFSAPDMDRIDLSNDYGSGESDNDG
jgi:hypothetical protein